MKIYVLNDNRNSLGFESEHGFSILIEKEEKRILFDCGQSDLYLKNARRLFLDMNYIDDIVLSHGDYDHANGLKYLKLKNKACVYSHPFLFDYRISKRRGVYAGINQTKNEIEKKYQLNLSDKPIEICKGVFFLGEIKRENPNEINLPMLCKNKQDFLHLDDTGIAIKTDNGLVVISGCAHSGICNTIRHACNLLKEQRVFAVMGGFHLKDVNEKIDYVINYLNDVGVSRVYLAHCTSDKCIEEFKKRLKAETFVCASGKMFEI